MSEGKLRLVSLSVLGGRLHGRRYDPDEVVTEILIGSDSSCHLAIDLPSVSPIHAKVWADLDQSFVHDTHAPRGVYVNTEKVVDRAPIGEGDVVWLGAPQDHDSVCIKCHFEPWVEVLPTVEALAPEEAVVFDDAAAAGGAVSLGDGDASSTVAFTRDSVPSVAASDAEGATAIFEPEPASSEEPAAEPPVSQEPEPAPEPVEAVFESAALSAEATLKHPPASGGDEDPFFVGEETALPEAAPEALFDMEGQPAAGERPPPEVPEPATEGAAPPGERSADAQAEPIPLAVDADDWAITEPPAAAPESTPEPAADEFFVAGEAMAPVVEEAAFVEAEPLPAEPAPGAAAFLDLPPLEPLAPPPPPPPAPPPPPPPAPPPAAQVPAAPAAAPAAPVPAPAQPPEPAPPEPPAPEAEVPRATGPAAVSPRPVSPPRAQPAPARRAAPAAAAPQRAAPARRPAPGARPAARAAVGGAPAWLRPLGLAAAGLVVVGGIAFGVSRLLGGSLRLDAIEPARVRVGQRATLTGSGFGREPLAQTVLFGDREAKVLEVSPQRLEVEVPEAVVEAGAEGRIAVVVKKGGRVSAALDVTVFQGPRLHGISPEAAMPGEEVLLAGAGWGLGATVQFGSSPAQLIEVQSTRIRALVPEIAGGPGTEARVVVTVGGVESNPAPFVLGRLPVVSRLAPATASPGDVVTLAGRGFQAEAARNDVRVGGIPALVIEATGDTLRLVVPRLDPGPAARPVELRVPGSTNVGVATLQLAAPVDPVEFRFIAEPFTQLPGRAHAVLATGLGPAFVLAASGAQAAAARAAAAAERLNAAAQPLRTTVGLTVEARGLESSPVIGLAGRSEVLLEVTEADAAAYNEDWTGLRGRGGPVTRARLARWWEALARDLVLLTIRGEAPRYAAELAQEGRALRQLFDAAQRSGRPGVPLQVLQEARPPLREGLRLLAYRVPPSVTAPVPGAAAAAAPVAAATPTPPPLVLEGTWAGSQVEQGQRQYLTVEFQRDSGTVAFEGGITFKVPMLSLERPRKDQVHFSVQIRGGIRHFAGRWDGDSLSGSVSTDAAGKNVVATFELRRR